MKKAAIAISLFFASGVALAQAPDAAPKGDPAAGKVKATAICSGCHGASGTRTAFPEVYNVPKIGGQNEGYIVAALKAYKAGERYNQTMRAQATGLSDKEISDIAAYYAQGSAQTALK